MTLEAVLFDMDGTLVDTEGLWWQAATDAAADLGYRLGERDTPDVLGRDIEHCAGHLLRVTGTGRGRQDVAAELESRFAVLVEREVVPLPGAVELLDALRAQAIATALVTASPRRVVDIVLGALGAHWFAVTVSADDTVRTKPAPEPYLMAATLLRADPARCVAVEDTPTGVASAEAAGCRVLAIPSAVPIPAGARRTVLTSLEQVGPQLLRDLVLTG